MPRLIDQEKIKDLESLEPGEVVEELGIRTDDILRAFPGHVFDYSCILTVDDPDDQGAEEEIEQLKAQGYSVYYVEDSEEATSS